MPYAERWESSTDSTTPATCFASGLIAAGCDVVTVQRALGHSSAVQTLTTYSHLWPDASDRTRKAAGDLLDLALRSTADGLRTEAAKTPLD